jgi:Skp family chaperone for outer membrane proteins
VRKNFLFFFLIMYPMIAFSDVNFNVRAAVVDIEAILEQSLAMQHIRQVINNISEDIQSEMSVKEQELKKTEADLIKLRGVISDSDFDNKIAEFNQMVSQIQLLRQKKKAALEQAHAEAIAKVHKNTMSIIHDIAVEHDFNLVFPSSQVLFAKSELNITLQVISKLNEVLKTIDVNYHFESSQKK